MKTKVTLVNPPGDILNEEHLEPPLGLLSIATQLEKHLAIRCTVLDLTKHSISEAEKILSAHEADIFGFTVYCTKWEITRQLISTIHSHSTNQPLIVLGGPNPTALPEETLSFGPVNAVICGEGEKAFRQLVIDYNEGKITNKSKEIIYSDRLLPEEFIPVDYSFVEPLNTYKRTWRGQSVFTLEASRGCSNKCIFCNSTIMGSGSNGKVTCKPAELILKEISAAKKLGYSVFRFNDDSFVYAANQSNLLDKLSDMNIQYRIFANAKDLTRESVTKLKRSGCFHISVGIESYNPKNLKIIGKNTSAKQVREGINIASQAGITVRSYFILGLPFDSNENIQFFMKKVAEEVNFHEFCLYPLIPYPGTFIWKRPEQFGYQITDRSFDNYVQIGKNRNSALVLDHKDFSNQDVKRWLNISDEILTEAGKIHSSNSEVV